MPRTITVNIVFSPFVDPVPQQLRRRWTLSPSSVSPNRVRRRRRPHLLPFLLPRAGGGLGGGVHVRGALVQAADLGSNSREGGGIGILLPFVAPADGGGGGRRGEGLSLQGGEEEAAAGTGAV